MTYVAWAGQALVIWVGVQLGLQALAPVSTSDEWAQLRGKRCMAAGLCAAALFLIERFLP